MKMGLLATLAAFAGLGGNQGMIQDVGDVGALVEELAANGIEVHATPGGRRTYNGDFAFELPTLTGVNAITDFSTDPRVAAFVNGGRCRAGLLIRDFWIEISSGTDLADANSAEKIEDQIRKIYVQIVPQGQGAPIFLKSTAAVGTYLNTSTALGGAAGAGATNTTGTRAIMRFRLPSPVLVDLEQDRFEFVTNGATGWVAARPALLNVSGVLFTNEWMPQIRTAVERGQCRIRVPGQRIRPLAMVANPDWRPDGPDAQERGNGGGGGGGKRQQLIQALRGRAGGRTPDRLLNLI